MDFLRKSIGLTVKTHGLGILGLQKPKKTLGFLLTDTKNLRFSYVFEGPKCPTHVFSQSNNDFPKNRCFFFRDSFWLGGLEPGVAGLAM